MQRALARRCLEGKHSHGQGQGLSLPFVAQNHPEDPPGAGLRASEQLAERPCWLPCLQRLLYLGALAVCPCVSLHACAATRVYMHVCAHTGMKTLQGTW